MNRRHFLALISLILALTLALAACRTPAPTPDTANDMLATVVAATLQATPAELATATAPAVALASPTPAPASPTPLPPTATFTPSPSPTPDCTDRVKFVSETVKDGSTFSPGQKIEKTWRLRNDGTCTWTTEYALVFDNGDAMQNIGPLPLAQAVPPQGEAEISVTLTAPAEPGSYQSNWKLRNTRNELFGLGKEASEPFWVKITVADVGTGLDLGTPAWIDGFDDNSSSFYLGSDSDVEFSLDDGELELTAKTVSGDQWRVAERPGLIDFYLEMLVRTGKECSGKDSYGFILRAPEAGDGVIDSGYVFTFSCDGQYRVYRMDDGSYTGLLNWRAVADLNRGPEASNKIGVLARGETFTIYINGVQIDEFTDNTYDEGLFGVSVRSDGTPDFKVYLDQLAYWNVP